MPSILGWTIGIVLLAMPIMLCLFTVFLLMTDEVSEDRLLDEGSWGQDIDQMAKKRYKSNL